MVVINIYIEGGVLEHANNNVLTMNNSQRLRESFHHLLSQKIDATKFKLEVYNGSGIKQTINFFKAKLNKGEEVFLLIDLDSKKSQRLSRLQELELNDKSHSEKVYFMIQEMEAWILSQPDKIEECFRNLKRVKSNKELIEDNILKDKEPEEIVKPSEKLHTLLGRYYRIEKKGKERKKKYSKLRDGADLIQLLDFDRLEQTFEDVRNFHSMIKEKKT